MGERGGELVEVAHEGGHAEADGLRGVDPGAQPRHHLDRSLGGRHETSDMREVDDQTNLQLNRKVTNFKSE